MQGASFKVTKATKEKWSFDYDQIIVDIEAMYEEDEYLLAKIRHVDFIWGVESKSDSPSSWNFPTVNPEPMPINELYTDKILIYAPKKREDGIIINVVNPTQLFNMIGETSANATHYQIELDI